MIENPFIPNDSDQEKLRPRNSTQPRELTIMGDYVQKLPIPN